jgi:hypothetical protein
MCVWWRMAMTSTSTTKTKTNALNAVSLVFNTTTNTNLRCVHSTVESTYLTMEEMERTTTLSSSKMPRKKYRNGTLMVVAVVASLCCYQLFFSSSRDYLLLLQSPSSTGPAPQMAATANKTIPNISNNKTETTVSSNNKLRMDQTTTNNITAANLAISVANAKVKGTNPTAVPIPTNSSFTSSSRMNTLPAVTAPTASTTITASASTILSPIIVVKLHGELANHMGGLAQAKGLQLLLRDTYGLNATMVILPQTKGKLRVHPKFYPTRKALRTCFPALNDQFGNFKYDFQAHAQRKKQQNAWFSRDEIQRFQLVGITDTAANVTRALQFFHELWMQKSTTPNTTTTTPPTLGANATISTPFLYTNTHKPSFLLDRYSNEIRQLFAMNETACCKEIPDPDESVFVRFRCLILILFLCLEEEECMHAVVLVDEI